MLFDFRSWVAFFTEQSYSYPLSQILFRERITWDLVNSSGMNHSIIIVAILVLIFGLEFWKGNDKKYAISAAVSIVILTAICCRARFQGWYLMPVIFFVCTTVSSGKYILIPTIINTLLLMPYVKYQVLSKQEQIENMAHIEELRSFCYGINEKYEGYTPVYFVEVCLDDLPFASGYDFGQESPHNIIYITKRARAQSTADQIYFYAESETNGFLIVESDEVLGITAIMHEAEDDKR